MVFLIALLLAAMALSRPLGLTRSLVEKRGVLFSLLCLLPAVLMDTLLLPVTLVVAAKRAVAARAEAGEPDD